MSENPYQAPTSAVLDPVIDSEDGFTGEIYVRDASAGSRWLGHAWRLFNQAPGLWIGFICVIMAISIAVQILGPFGGIASSLLTPILSGGIMIGCHRAYSGGTLEFDDIFKAFRAPHLAPLLIMGAIYLVAAIVVVAVSILPFIGTLFLIVASGDFGAMEMLPILLGLCLFGLLMVPLMAATWMAGPLIVLNQVAPLDALKMSMLGCFKNWLPFLIYSLLLLPLAIAATLPLLLGWLVLAPVIIASVYASYRDIYYADGGDNA